VHRGQDAELGAAAADRVAVFEIRPA